MLRIILALCLFAFPALAAPADPSPLAGSTNLPAAPVYQTTAPFYTCPTASSGNWYVDGTLGNDGNPGHGPGSAALKTIGQATWNNPNLQPGQCVNVAPGTYAEYVWVKNQAGNGGTAGLPIVVRSSGGPGAAKIAAPTTYGESPVEMPASYAVLDGFDVTGGQVNNGVNCIDGGFNWSTNHAHHLTVVNNIVHGCGGGGIEMAGGDWYTIVGNTVYGNASMSGYQTSGISIASAYLIAPDSGDTSAYHNVVAYNISYNNMETFSCSSLGMGSGCHSDGEGIIIDCFDCQSFAAYTAKTLVIGNVTYGNGGNGIQVGRSSNVTVAQNLACNNMLDTQNGGTARSELGNFRGSNNIWVNNVAVSYRGTGVLANNVALLDEGAGSQGGITYPSTGVIWENNWGWDVSGTGPYATNGATPASISSAHNSFGANPYLGTSSSCPQMQNPPSTAPVVVQVPVPAQTYQVPVAAQSVPVPALSVAITGATPGSVSVPVPNVTVAAQSVPYTVPAYTVPYTVSPGSGGISPVSGAGEPEGWNSAPDIGP